MNNIIEVPLMYNHHVTSLPNWSDLMVEMVQAYIRGEPQFIKFSGSDDKRRTGSIARLYISNTVMQDILHGSTDRSIWGFSSNPPRKIIEVKEENVKPSLFRLHRPDFQGRWDGRRKVGTTHNGWAASWLKGYNPAEGTKWVWSTPEQPTEDRVIPLDKLKREINVGDFISYILYHFDNGSNSAGIYYGKVTKVDHDGTVYAKNIKLKSDDVVAEKRIKDNSLVVIMTKDLMNTLMMARLSIS